MTPEASAAANPHLADLERRPQAEPGDLAARRESGLMLLSGKRYMEAFDAAGGRNPGIERMLADAGGLRGADQDSG